MELLSAGTSVRVQNLLGKVVSAKMVKAVPCGFVALHRIKYTHRVVSRTKTVELKNPISKFANYSFIFANSKEMAVQS